MRAPKIDLAKLTGKERMERRKALKAFHAQNAAQAAKDAAELRRLRLNVLQAKAHGERQQALAAPAMGLPADFPAEARALREAQPPSEQGFTVRLRMLAARLAMLPDLIDAADPLDVPALHVERDALLREQELLQTQVARVTERRQESNRRRIDRAAEALDTWSSAGGTADTWAAIEDLHALVGAQLVGLWALDGACTSLRKAHLLTLRPPAGAPDMATLGPLIAQATRQQMALLQTLGIMVARHERELRKAG